jgi:hypothetical protein
MNSIWMAFQTPVSEDIRATLKEWVPRDLGILILIGTLLLVATGAFIWAAFLRKQRRRSHYEFHQHPPERQAKHREEKPKGNGFFFHKRRHRRHRYSRRNPTLAEAGGLPPIRTEEHPPTST